jgi:hypothetical protein
LENTSGLAPQHDRKDADSASQSTDEAIRIKFERIELKHVGGATMTELKTKPSAISFETYLTSIADEARRADCVALAHLMSGIVGQPAVMWGPSIVGFGRYHYRYQSGREGDMCLTGFASRKKDLTIYLAQGYTDDQALLAELGSHRSGVGCLYIKSLKDVSVKVLKKLIVRSIETTRKRYPD